MHGNLLPCCRYCTRRHRFQIISHDVLHAVEVDEPIQELFVVLVHGAAVELEDSGERRGEKKCREGRRGVCMIPASS